MKKLEQLLTLNDLAFLKELKVNPALEPSAQKRKKPVPEPMPAVPWRLTDNAGTVLYEHTNLDAVLWVGLDPEQEKSFRFLRIDRCPTAAELKTMQNFCGYMPTLVFRPANLNPPLGSLVAELWSEDPL